MGFPLDYFEISRKELRFTKLLRPLEAVLRLSKSGRDSIGTLTIMLIKACHRK